MPAPRELDRCLGPLGRLLLYEVEQEPCGRCGAPKGEHTPFGDRLLCRGSGSDLDYLPTWRP